MAQRCVGECRLCGRSSPLVEAHIVPSAIAKAVGSPGDPGRVYNVGGSEHPKRLPTGWYDPQILCEVCDGRRLGPLDQYGVEFLRNVEQYRVEGAVANGATIAVRKGADPVRLKSFALSVLWRAAVSRRPEFAQVSLGAFEPALRRRVLDSSTDSVDEFATTFTWCHDDPGELIIPPTPRRFRDGVRAYIMHLASHTIAVKVDSRPAPEFARALLLDPHHEVSVRVESLLSGPFAKAFPKLIASAAKSTRRQH